MKFAVISGNPKTTGLCRSVTDAAIRGAADAGAEAREIRMAGMTYCRMCGDGWGICRSEHKCAFGDDGFAQAHETVLQADALVIITPVYWVEMSEGLKGFLDRLRRCEPNVGLFAGQGKLSGKPALLVASAGGSGKGTLTTLTQFERFCDHTGIVIFDFISVNRWNGDYKREAAYSAAYAMACGRKAGDTIALAP